MRIALATNNALPKGIETNKIYKFSDIRDILKANPEFNDSCKRFCMNTVTGLYEYPSQVDNINIKRMIAGEFFPKLILLDAKKYKHLIYFET